MMRAMSELVLGPMLRYVSEHEATIWVETSAACEVEVLGTTTRTFEVGGHHYALVIIGGLEPDSITPYEVHLGGARVWPLDDSDLRPSVIRTLGGNRPTRLLFGSCRSAAPHEPPFTLDADEDEEGRGVDALRAHGLRMLHAESPRDWPDLLILGGDQVYADDASPDAKRRVEARREREDGSADLPPAVVADFEEYTWLYHESWLPEIERWVFSVVPTAMIFDDHDVIDDWNTSAAWVRETRAEPWWHEHIIGAMVSYWIYQHLGNLSPGEIEREGLLARVLLSDDAEAVLRRWAFESESSTPIPGGYPFSFYRRFGDVEIIMIDVRNGRVLEEQDRRLVDEGEWGWIVDRASEPCRHLVLVSSLPVFAPGGIHGLQQWSEAICQGAWGRPGSWIGEKVRRALDTEHWPAFDRSFRDFEQLLLRRGTETADNDPPATITVIGGDIHFSYAVAVEPRVRGEMTSRVHQVVSSPIRHILAGRDRRLMRFAGSKAGRRTAEFLQRRSGRGDSAMVWDLGVEPIFDNAMGQIEFFGDRATLRMERAGFDDDGNECLTEFTHLEL
jgi:hypothetical protein